jgi:hypothetical protein
MKTSPEGSAAAPKRERAPYDRETVPGEGSWWSSTTCSHVGFESLLERDFLMLADYDRDVVGIASQPFAVLWPKGTDSAAAMCRTSFCDFVTAADESWMCGTRSIWRLATVSFP